MACAEFPTSGLVPNVENCSYGGATGYGGIYVYGSEISVKGNTVVNNGVNNIRVFGGDAIEVTGNKVRTGDNLPDYGVSVRNTASNTNIFVAFNDLYNSGEMGDCYLHPAQGVFGHNRKNDGTYSTVPDETVIP